MTISRVAPAAFIINAEMIYSGQKLRTSLSVVHTHKYNTHNPRCDPSVNFGKVEEFSCVFFLFPKFFSYAIIQRTSASVIERMLIHKSRSFPTGGILFGVGKFHGQSYNIFVLFFLCVFPRRLSLCVSTLLPFVCSSRSKTQLRQRLLIK